MMRHARSRRRFGGNGVGWLATLATLATLAFVAGCDGSSENPAGESGRPFNAATNPEQSGVSGREVTTPGGVAMVRIPAGEFVMGSDAAVDSVPVRKVAISEFHIDKQEVTQALYEKITGKNPSRRVGPEHPVERVRWREAIAFCNQRSTADGLRPCYDAKTGACDFSADGYRLPTEAEWEYACRAGAEDAYPRGDDPRQPADHAWFKKNAGLKTHPVGRLTPNAWGLFDMSGNVWEWCNDWYQVDAYASAGAADPRGPDHGEKKVLRGGGFKSAAEDCTSASRQSDDPGFTDACVATDDYGFRCVRRPAPSKP
jgi:formylglycine-generating enzyme required for sulfatase activity